MVCGPRAFTDGPKTACISAILVLRYAEGPQKQVKVRRAFRLAVSLVTSHLICENC